MPFCVIAVLFDLEIRKIDHRKFTTEIFPLRKVMAIFNGVDGTVRPNKIEQIGGAHETPDFPLFPLANCTNSMSGNVGLRVAFTLLSPVDFQFANVNF